jgi:transcription-repair coupling factor (superfamily II helicase)
MPKQVVDLFDTIRSRRLAVALGFERMLLKDEQLRCYFINKADSPYFESSTFQSILTFLQTQTNKAKLKQVGKLFLLIVEDVKSMQQILAFLQRMKSFTAEKEEVN